MSDIIISAESKGKDFDPVPAGLTIAHCFAIYDVGTIHDERYGKDKHEIIITFECPEHRGQFKDKSGTLKDLPRAISTRYTASLGEKANLRRDLVNWRGRDFTADELKAFSLKNILGKACQLLIVHAPGKDGKVWANINAIMPAPKGYVAKLENPTVMWRIGDPTDGVPAFVLKRATQAKEWADVQEPPVTQAAPKQEEEQEEVPF